MPRTTEVWFFLPVTHSDAMDKFLRECGDQDIISRAEVRDSKIIWVTKESSEEIPAKKYTVQVCGGEEEAKKFVLSLFEKNLIPSGREWTVYRESAP